MSVFTRQVTDLRRDRTPGGSLEAPLATGIVALLFSRAFSYVLQSRVWVMSASSIVVSFRGLLVSSSPA
jgi:hypothetical protein